VAADPAPASSATATPPSAATAGPAGEGRQFVNTPHRYDPVSAAEEYDLTPLSRPGAAENEKLPKPVAPVPASPAKAPAPQAKASQGAKVAMPAPSRKLVNILTGISLALLVSNVVTFALLLSRGGQEKGSAAPPPAVAGATGGPSRPAPAAAPSPAAVTAAARAIGGTPAPAPAAIKPRPAAAGAGPSAPPAVLAEVAVVAPRKLTATPGAGDNNRSPSVLVPHADPKSLTVKYRTGAQDPWTDLADWPTQELAISGAAHVLFEADASAQGGLKIKARSDDELNRLVQGPRSQPASLRIAVLKKALDSCQVRVEDASGRPLADFHFALVAPG
jgi:hypothetical protein